MPEPEAALKKTVVITETITERRTYEVDAFLSDAEAALEAYNIWIVNGVDPEDGVSLSVDDRTYEVDGKFVEVADDGKYAEVEDN